MSHLVPYKTIEGFPFLTHHSYYAFLHYDEVLCSQAEDNEYTLEYITEEKDMKAHESP